MLSLCPGLGEKTVNRKALKAAEMKILENIEVSFLNPSLLARKVVKAYLEACWYKRPLKRHLSYLEVKEITYTDKRPSTTRTELVKVWVYVKSKCGRKFHTYWIPDQGRWSGFTKKVPPVLFCDAPKFPGEK